MKNRACLFALLFSLGASTILMANEQPRDTTAGPGFQNNGGRLVRPGGSVLRDGLSGRRMSGQNSGPGEGESSDPGMGAGPAVSPPPGPPDYSGGNLNSGAGAGWNSGTHPPSGNDGSGGKGSGAKGDGDPSVHSMPEPSAIPEFAAFAGGLSLLAWRRRKLSAADSCH